MCPVIRLSIGRIIPSKIQTCKNSAIFGAKFARKKAISIENAKTVQVFALNMHKIRTAVFPGIKKDPRSDEHGSYINQLC